MLLLPQQQQQQFLLLPPQQAYADQGRCMASCFEDWLDHNSNNRSSSSFGGEAQGLSNALDDALRFLSSNSKSSSAVAEENSGAAAAVHPPPLPLGIEVDLDAISNMVSEWLADYTACFSYFCRHVCHFHNL